MWTIQRKILTVLNVLAFALLIVAGMKMLFKWDWNLPFTAILLIVVGAYLIIASQIKNIRSYKFMGGKVKKYFAGTMNALMLAFGVLLIYMGVTILPFLSVLSIEAISKFNGWVLLIGGVLSVLDNFNWI